MSVVTRFAPSPSGSLHLGGARTALFNYLYAKANNGKFLLRIENSDKERSSDESIENIISALNWLGLNYTEPVVYQSKNIKNHVEVANSLLSKNLAYKCFHNQEYINQQILKNKKFKSEWRDVPKEKYPKDQIFSIRLKTPIDGICRISDNIQGNVSVNYEEIDDYIILRSDGTPTFLLSSVVDDCDMSISDIIRGDDHLTNSFRQKVIFDFLNYKPNFSHISLIHNESNQKLSKRDNAPSILDYKKRGFLPSSLNNYMLRLGWSHGNQEFFRLEEAEKIFSLKNIGKSPSKHDEKKIKFLNNYYIKNSDDDELLKIMKKIGNFEQILNKFSGENNLRLINLFKDRADNLLDIVENIHAFNVNPKEYTKNELEILEILKDNQDLILKKFESIVDWNYENVNNELNKIISDLKISFKSFAQPVRFLIIGKINGPSISKLVFITGKNQFISLIQNL